MKPRYSRYLELRSTFAVSREMAAAAIEWAQPHAVEALGAHGRRDHMGLEGKLPVFPVLTTAEENGGWGELMPVWFKPYERPVPLMILDNWALTALVWEHWLGDAGPAFNVENLLKVLVGSNMLIPFLPATQRGGHYLRHGALTVLLSVLWLPADDRDALLRGLAAGGGRFADENALRDQADLAGFMDNVEAFALMVAEGSKIGGGDKVRAFLDNAEAFDTYAALYGGLFFSLAALHAHYGPQWQDWIFQAINVHYRYAAFGLEAWAKWLEIRSAHDSIWLPHR